MKHHSDPPSRRRYGHIFILVSRAMSALGLAGGRRIEDQELICESVCRMVADGAVPNTKTFTALIGSFGKMGSVGAALDIITELLGHDQGMAASASTYAALMAACEKAGQGDLALALFEKMKAQVPSRPDNSLACT